MTPEELRMLAMFGSASGAAIAGPGSFAAGMNPVTQNLISTQAKADMLGPLFKILSGGGSIKMDGTKTNITMPHALDQSVGAGSMVPDLPTQGESNGAAATGVAAPTGISPHLLSAIMMLAGGGSNGNNPFAFSLPSGAGLAGLTPNDINDAVKSSLGVVESQQRGQHMENERANAAARLAHDQNAEASTSRRLDIAEETARLAAEKEARLAAKPSAEREKFQLWQAARAAKGLSTDYLAYTIDTGLPPDYNAWRDAKVSGLFTGDYPAWKTATSTGEYDRYAAEERTFGRVPMSRQDWAGWLVGIRAVAGREPIPEAAARTGAKAEAETAVRSKEFYQGKGLSDFVEDQVKANPFYGGRTLNKTWSDQIERQRLELIDRELRTKYPDIVRKKDGWYLNGKLFRPYVRGE